MRRLFLVLPLVLLLPLLPADTARCGPERHCTNFDAWGEGGTMAACAQDALSSAWIHCDTPWCAGQCGAVKTSAMTYSWFFGWTCVAQYSCVQCGGGGPGGDTPELSGEKEEWRWVPFLQYRDINAGLLGAK